MNDLFRKLAQYISKATGSVWTFFLAVSIIIVWGMTGPITEYSTTWQLTINSFTTIITFLMVFLIQNTQNRDSKAVHLKLDELIRAIRGARNNFIDTDVLSDKDLEQMHQEFIKLSQKYEQALKQRRTKRKATEAAAKK